MINNFKNPAFADTWGKKRDELIRNSIIDKFGDKWFGKIVAWLAKYTGIGNWMFNNKLRDRMKGFGVDLSSALPGGALDNMFSIAAKARADEARQNAEAKNGKTTGGVAQVGLPRSQNPQPVANAGAAAGAAPVPAAPADPAAQPVVAAPVDPGRPPVGVNVDKYGNPVPV
jgi:hypothetical protein